MGDSTSDFLVVGAGQNLLSAAAYLARSGHSVTVLEKHDYWGGGCITKEVTLPGFKHDLHATSIFMAQGNPLIRLDELELFSRFGLRYADAHGPVHGTVFDDGSAVALFTDLERSCESIARYSPGDADAYREFVHRALKFVPMFAFALFAPPADGAKFTALLNSSAEGRYLLDFLNASVVDLVNRHFSDERTKVHLVRLASEMMMRPNLPGSGFGLLLMGGMYHIYRPGTVIGGTQGFADALVRCIRHHGGEVVTGAEVNKVIVENGRATAVQTTDGRRFAAKLAVVAGLPPWRLDNYVEGTQALAEKVRQVPNSDYTCFLTHAALNEAPDSIAAPEFHKMGCTIITPASVEALVRMTEDATQGRLPRDFSASYYCATNEDPTRAPDGKATLYLYRVAPRIPQGKTIEHWDEIKDSFGNDMLAQARRYIPNLTPDNILAVTHESPYDYQKESPSFTHGDITGLAMTPEQFLSGRPIAELANYRVPGVEGLYLCGPFMHPGGGVSGGGRPVAMRVMMDLGMDLNTTFRI